MAASPFSTTHTIITADARDLGMLPDGSVDLVVTSPPYPMIRMWDSLFSGLSPDIAYALKKPDGYRAFELMHRELDKVWHELYRVCRSGSFVCINIGDATRTIGGTFMLYSNHSRIIAHCVEAGFDCLPIVLWRKQTNAPNKFMGSGMLPAGAYVTLEHEYILIFRKDGKRVFTSEAAKHHRMESALFWEERNTWFSDLWDFKGIKQNLQDRTTRERSAAFPMELARRLILMYSLYADTVLDPFAGTGTTMLAAGATGRNSIGVDVAKEFVPLIGSQFDRLHDTAEGMLADRIDGHRAFVAERPAERSPLGNVNKPHGFPVMTKQEMELLLKKVVSVDRVNPFEYAVVYEDIGRLDAAAAGIYPKGRNAVHGKGVSRNTPDAETGQMSLDI
jgi:DNA modification methylase